MGELRPSDPVLSGAPRYLVAELLASRCHAVLLLGPCLAVAVLFGGMTREGAMKSLGVSETDKPQQKKPSSLTL